MPVIGITICPHCKGQFIVDKVPAFSGCLQCGFDGPPTAAVGAAALTHNKWSEVVADGRRLGWEATVKKWNLGKTARKRLKNSLQEKEMSPLAETLLAMGKERQAKGVRP